jgi:long-chain acyl-CoA synthetase
VTALRYCRTNRSITAAEFLITDLALASHSIPSFTLTSPTLLAPVLEAHPPTAIVIDAGFVPHVLELLFDAAEAAHHVVVVVGELDKQTASRIANRIRLVRWSDIEAEGASGEQLAPPTPPGKYYSFSIDRLLHTQ